jgi:sigma-54 specific flagellar transcriptional regulator A
MMQVAKRPVTVLVTGESGTGKEIVARNLHYHAGRAEKSFVVLNCAAISPERFDIELFGHEKGFNGIPGNFIGLLEKADGGTLLLDEVSELPLPVQGKLLRFLEDKTLQRIGGSEQIVVDVRVVAGTQHPLHELARKGSFREDLYYRLSVVPIELPSLRDRREDIPVLINELTARLESDGYESLRFNSSAIQSLQQHDWPGNVRELANLVERLCIMQPNAIIGSNDLPPQYRYKIEASPAEAVIAGLEKNAAILVPTHGTVVDMSTMLPLNEERLQQYLDNFERQLLAVALDDSAGLIDYAAERVQLDVQSFKARLQVCGLLPG